MQERKIILNKHRYRLYREHKFIFDVFGKLLSFVSSMDFNNEISLSTLKGEINNLDLLLQAHAEHEDNRIHVILKFHHSPVFQEAEQHHQQQQLDLDNLNKKITLIESVANREEITFIGYEIYLDLRKFFCDNLNHFDYEERVIMPELQRLLSDDEIREVDRASYKAMLPEDMIQMMEVLFPHMNYDDKFTFLKDIKDCEPQKFELAWLGVASIFEATEKANLEKSLNIV